MKRKKKKQTVHLLDMEKFEKADDAERREMVREFLIAIRRDAVDDDGDD